MTSRTVSISLNENLLDQLDHEREDVPRSRYIERLLEKELGRK